VTTQGLKLGDLRNSTLPKFMSVFVQYFILSNAFTKDVVFGCSMCLTSFLFEKHFMVRYWIFISNV